MDSGNNLTQKVLFSFFSSISYRMKKCGFVFTWLLLLFAGCSQAIKDRDVKSTIASRAKQEIAFAGVNYTVQNGLVILTGNCPTEKEKTKVEGAVKQTAGVKDVVSQILIAPVVLNSDFPLKQAADSVLQKYATVQATVKDSIVAVEGTVQNEKVGELINALQSLKPKGLINNTTRSAGK